MAEIRPEMRGAAWQIAVEKFKGVTSTDETAVTVGTTVTEVAPADPERVMVMLINLATATMHVAPTNQVSATRGIALGPAGGALISMVGDDGELTTRAWFAIGGIAAGTCYRATVRRHTAAPR